MLGACGGLAQSWQHAAVRVSTRSKQPDGTSAKRALRAAAPVVPGTASCGRLCAVLDWRPDAGPPRAEAESVGACPGWQTGAKDLAPSFWRVYFVHLQQICRELLSNFLIVGNVQKFQLSVV